MSDGEAPRESAEPASDPSFRALLDKLSADYNFDVREYKEVSLARRVRARMSHLHVERFDEYASYLDHHPDEHVALFNTILINVTGFFRDPDAWKSLADEVIPSVAADAGESRSIRVWSAGCSSGEETYSLAILLAEHLGERAGELAVKVYGTDIDEEALATARHALYRLDQLKDVPPDLLERYFVRDGQLFRLRRDIRRWCVFGVHNVTQAPPLSHVDLLICRNVLIYFKADLQERVMARFHYAIREGGYLFLGRSESLLARSHGFAPVDLKWRIFQRLPNSHAASVLAEAAPGGSAQVPRPEAPSSTVRIQRALEALPVAVMIVDTSDTILMWNAAAEHLFDIPVASALARKFRDLAVSYRVEGLRARVEEAKARRAAARIEEVTFSRPGGQLVHAEITIAPLFEGYRLIGVLVCAADATEQARLREQAMRISEQHATAIEELQSTNEELETTNEELQSTNEELETTVQELQAANAELGTLNAELESRTGELNRLDSEHRSFLNSLPEAVVVVDRDLVVTTWSLAAERILSLRSAQAVGRHVSTLALGAVGRYLREAFEAAITASESREASDLDHSDPAGRTGRLEVHVVPLRSGAGEVTGAIAVMRAAVARSGA